MVYFELQDSPGYINATAIGEPVEKNLLFTAQNLMEHTLLVCTYIKQIRLNFTDIKGFMIANNSLQLDVRTNILDFICSAIENDKVFYIQAVQREPNSAQYRYDVIFMLDPILSKADDKNEVTNKGNGHIYPYLSSCLSNEETPPAPTAKRSLLQSLEIATPTKKKIEHTMME